MFNGILKKIRINITIFRLIVLLTILKRSTEQQRLRLPKLPPVLLQNFNYYTLLVQDIARHL